MHLARFMKRITNIKEGNVTMRRKGENGAIILESTYCILLSTIVFFFLISLSFYLYDQTLITIIANQTASEVAQTYKLRYVEDSSELSSEDISGIGKYRYLFFKESFDSANRNKARTMTNMRLEESSFAEEEGWADITIETVVDDIGRRHYVVTVKQESNFLLGSLLETFGIDVENTLKATSYATSVDVLSYVNTVKLTKYGCGKLEENSFVKMFDSAIKLLHTIFDD